MKRGSAILGRAKRIPKRLWETQSDQYRLSRLDSASTEPRFHKDRFNPGNLNLPRRPLA